MTYLSCSPPLQPCPGDWQCLVSEEPLNTPALQTHRMIPGRLQSHLPHRPRLLIYPLTEVLLCLHYGCVCVPLFPPSSWHFRNCYLPANTAQLVIGKTKWPIVSSWLLVKYLREFSYQTSPPDLSIPPHHCSLSGRAPSSQGRRKPK